MSHTVEAKRLEEVGYITVCKPYSVDPLASVPWADVLIDGLDATKFPYAGEGYFLQPLRPSSSWSVCREALGANSVTWETISELGSRFDSLGLEDAAGRRHRWYTLFSFVDGQHVPHQDFYSRRSAGRSHGCDQSLEKNRSRFEHAAFRGHLLPMVRRRTARPGGEA